MAEQRKLTMILSIITINRNNASGLEQTIKSVLGQTFTDFEYIIVDGASTDGSIDIINRYQHNFNATFKWVSEPDDGIYNAMNKGAQMALGDYILFLNGGDTLVDCNVIEHIINYSLSADIIIGRINFIDGKGKFHKDYKQTNLNNSLIGFLDSRFPHQATLIKRISFLSAGLYDERYNIVADWQYCLKSFVFMEYTFDTLPVTISNFDNTGISSIHNKTMMEEIEKAFRDTLPPVIYNDYCWALAHISDLKRLLWLCDHKVPHFIFKLFIKIGRCLHE